MAAWGLSNGSKALVIGALGAVAQLGVIGLAISAIVHPPSDWTIVTGTMLFLQAQATTALGFLAGSSSPDPARTPSP